MIQIPVSHPAFADHFPGNPIVPGAMLLDLALAACRELGYTTTAIRRCKFLDIVFPGDALDVVIKPGTGAVDLRLYRDEKVVLQATLAIHE